MMLSAAEIRSPSRILPRHRRPPPPAGAAPRAPYGAGARRAPRPCAACAATRRSANGSTTSAPRRWNASACAAATANTARRSLSAMRSLLTRVDPVQLDAALRAWHQAHGGVDSALAIDGKTLRGAIDADGNQAHVLGIVGHESNAAHGAKKVGLRPHASDAQKRTNEIGTVIPLLETLPDIAGLTITADALLTQRRLADYLLGRGADYLFTVKGNQPTLHDEHPASARRERRPARSGLRRRDRKARTRPPRAPLHLGLQRTQRLPQLPRRRTGLRRAPGNRRGQGRQAAHRDGLRGHQPGPQGRHAATPAHSQSRALDHRGHTPHPRLELRRGPQPYPHRVRSGEHDPGSGASSSASSRGAGIAVAETMRNLARNPRRVLDFLKMTANASPTGSARLTAPRQPPPSPHPQPPASGGSAMPGCRNNRGSRSKGIAIGLPDHD